jgi:uncharacterized protein YndB with AHSA1/START domain
MTTKTKEVARRELTLTRIIDAPRELVFKAWTDAHHLARWWGPEGFSNPVCEVSARPGGTLYIVMRAPDGQDFPMKCTFKEVVAPERLVFSGFAHGGGEQPDLECFTTVTFEQQGTKTKVTVKQLGVGLTPASKQMLVGMEEGWNGSLDRLEDVAPYSDREIGFLRLLEAPRELIWKAFTDPKHIGKWWGPNGFTITTSKMEAKKNGEWVHVMHGPDGRDYKNRIKYLEVEKPERLVYEHVSTPPFLTTVTLTAVGKQTLLSWRLRFETAAIREQTAKTFGAVEGLEQTVTRLETLLSEFQFKPFLIQRVFDAPRELVYKAWTEPDRMQEWFGPKGLKTLSAKMDLRPGGVYHYGMQSPDGKKMWGKWVFREIVESQKLVFVSSFSDEKQGIARHPMSPDWPLETLSTILFEDAGKGKTKLTIQWTAIHASEKERKTFDSSHESMNGGWNGTLEQLTAYLAKDPSGR